MLDWLVVGGGIHGTFLSHVLSSRPGADRDRIRVLDPHERPFAQWRRFTSVVGMRYLRSPAVHNLDLNPFALERWAAEHGRKRQFRLPYRRPRLELFDAHADWVVDRHALDALRIRGVARGLAPVAGGWTVETDDGPLSARRVALAIGLGDQLAWPDWAARLRAEGAPVAHVFELSAPEDPAPTLIVGGGITAAQLAMRRAAAGVPTTLWSRHADRVHTFDSDPGWIGAKYMTGFLAERRPSRRRELIRAARHRGSCPPEVDRALRFHVHAGEITRLGGDLVSARYDNGRVDLSTTRGEVRAERVVLCTGFDAQRPGGPFLDHAVHTLGLHCATCGYPLVDRALQWSPGLHVLGPLAELELGPTARNIVGARAAALRLATIAA